MPEIVDFGTFTDKMLIEFHFFVLEGGRKKLTNSSK